MSNFVPLTILPAEIRKITGSSITYGQLYKKVLNDSIPYHRNPNNNRITVDPVAVAKALGLTTLVITEGAV